MSECKNVLSLFDGMRCAAMALQRSGVKINKYFSSEIDKHAIRAGRVAYPDAIELGSVTSVSAFLLPKIDLLVGGSPCQGFSFAGKQLNFEDPRSALFFEFVRLLKELRAVNPDIKFMLENVRMKQEFQDIMSEALGVKPIAINSNLLSAQNRYRLYWTNIQGIEQPKDKGILLKDIVHEGEGENEVLEEYIVPFDKTLKILDKEVERGKVGYFRKDSQANRVYYIHDKAVTLCGDAGGGAAKMGQYLFGHTNKNGQGDRVYVGEDKGCTLNAQSGGKADKGNLLFGCISPDRVDQRQEGRRFNEGKKFYTLTAQDRHGVLIEGYIRKLTPIECGRLQTIDDQVIVDILASGVSKTQVYKMLGNGWTVDVIAHIFNNL